MSFSRSRRLYINLVDSKYIHAQHTHTHTRRRVKILGKGLYFVTGRSFDRRFRCQRNTCYSSVGGAWLCRMKFYSTGYNDQSVPTFFFTVSSGRPSYRWIFFFFFLNAWKCEFRYCKNVEVWRNFFLTFIEVSSVQGTFPKFSTWRKSIKAEEKKVYVKTVNGNIFHKIISSFFKSYPRV